MSVKNLYQKLKSSQKNVSFDDINTHPDLHGIEDAVTIPFKRPIKEVYIKKALRKFDLANPDFGKE